MPHRHLLQPPCWPTAVLAALREAERKHRRHHLPDPSSFERAAAAAVAGTAPEAAAAGQPAAVHGLLMNLALPQALLQLQAKAAWLGLRAALLVGLGQLEKWQVAVPSGQGALLPAPRQWFPGVKKALLLRQ